MHVPDSDAVADAAETVTDMPANVLPLHSGQQAESPASTNSQITAGGYFPRTVRGSNPVTPAPTSVTGPDRRVL